MVSPYSLLYLLHWQNLEFLLSLKKPKEAQAYFYVHTIREVYQSRLVRGGTLCATQVISDFFK